MDKRTHSDYNIWDRIAYSIVSSISMRRDTVLMSIS
jgi:hypothetical protein